MFDICHGCRRCVSLCGSFPTLFDLVDESKIHEHLDHHAKRFEVTKLQDVELRHIVRGRVLRPKDAAAVKQAVNSLAERHQKVLPALLAGGDIGADAVLAALTISSTCATSIAAPR